MPIRLKLILPTVVILGAASLLALATATAADTAGALLAGLVLLALALVVAQLAAHERWVMSALRALGALVADDAAVPRAAPLPCREWRELQRRVAALRAESLQRHAALGQARDDTRRIEQALQLSEERYVLAVRGAQDGVWEHDLADGTVWLSPRCKHLLGLEHEADRIAADEWRARLHPDDRAAALAAFEAHLAGATERYQLECRMRHRDGRWRWLLSRGAAVRHASGKPYRVVGLDTDITRVKRVEQVIEAIADGTAGTSGTRFFEALVRHFARALCVECAFITVCADRPLTRARTLAFWRAGGFDANFEYELAGTPCEHVLRGGRPYFHRSGLAQSYPRECGSESYLGLPIFSRDGDVIGHLAFVDAAPMDDDMLIESVYRIFTARAAAELELEQALGRVAAFERQRVG